MNGLLMKRSLTPYLILAFFFALLPLALIAGSAQTPPKYMLLYQGSQGLNFLCLDELPYSDSRQMLWDDTLGATELSERGELYAQVIEVDDCYLDNIYLDPTSDSLYVFKFTSHDTDGHSNHRHMSRGVSWVEWLQH